MKHAGYVALLGTLLLLAVGPVVSGEPSAPTAAEKKDCFSLPDDPALAASRKTIPVRFLTDRLCPAEERLFADAADGHLDRFSLLQAALVANGVVRSDVLKRYEAQLDDLTLALAGRLKRLGESAGSPQRRARLVFESMHDQILYGGYDVDCSDLAAALDHGRYNCVSASVLFCSLAERLGLGVRGLQMPSHAMCRVSLPDGSFDVETTCPTWFRLAGDPKKQAELVEKTIGRSLQDNGSSAREISAVQMVAMIYYNRGFDLLGQKRFEAAAVANAKAVWLDPDNPTARGNLRATINNWAISLESEGDFARAAELLLLGTAFDSDYETFVLNYVHVQHQWMEYLCGLGEFEEALDVLARAAAEMPDRPYLRQAPVAVYRRWAAALRESGQPDKATAVAAEARRRHGSVSQP